MDFDKMFGNPNTQVYREEERDRMKTKLYGTNYKQHTKSISLKEKKIIGTLKFVFIR